MQLMKLETPEVRTLPQSIEIKTHLHCKSSEVASTQVHMQLSGSGLAKAEKLLPLVHPFGIA